MCAGVLVPATTADAFQSGFTLLGWTADSYLAPGSDQALVRMSGDGSTHAAVFTQWFMDSPTSSTLAPDAARTPSDAAIVHAIETAHQAGMEATLKPQIGIRTGSWIGAAHPADLTQFWASYRTMLLHYADLAEQSGAAMLVVGTEMGTLSWDQAHWRPLIAEVRQHFHGQLTYAANYDEFLSVPFWDALDYIGIDAYFSLADAGDPAPSVDALADAWTSRGYLSQIAAVSRATGKQVLFTEIGYRGIHSAAVHPNQWDADDATDVTAQANAYKAFYQAVADEPWLAGVYWWGVESDSWWVKDYNPLGKPAEDVMAAWNKRVPPASLPPTQDTQEPVDPQPQLPAGDPSSGTDMTPADPPPTASPPPAIAAPIRAPAITARVLGRRLVGRIERYDPGCNGTVSIRLRRMVRGHWRYVRPPRALEPTAAGRFSGHLRQGRLRVRAVFSSRCGHATSPWIGPAS